MRELWALSRIDLGLTDDEFLALSPAALGLLFDRLAARDKKALYNSALICAQIWNVNTDFEKRPEGWVPEDFMPGAKNRELDDLAEFARAVERGELEEPDPEDVEDFARRLKMQFGSING